MWLEILLPAAGVALSHLAFLFGPSFKLWHFIGVPPLLLAVTLPYKRRAERSVEEAATWHAVVRRKMWRTSTNILLGSVTLLIGSWLFDLADLESAARLTGVAGVSLAALALLPAPAELLLTRLGSAEMRRLARTTRLREELAVMNQAGSSSRAANRVIARRGWRQSDLNPIPEFDPDRGA